LLFSPLLFKPQEEEMWVEKTKSKQDVTLADKTADSNDTATAVVKVSVHWYLVIQKCSKILVLFNFKFFYVV